MRRIFITGIGTEVGKTIVSAVLAESLKADYWKPIQTGAEEYRDAEMVESLLSNKDSTIHPEIYLFKAPLSPDAAARLEQREVSLENIFLPSTKNDTLIIEGAGGLLVPLNDKETMLDLIMKLEAEVVLVSKNYLGSINHTLLSSEILKKKGCKVLGIVMNNAGNEASEDAISNFTELPILLKIKEEEVVNSEMIKRYASQISLGCEH